MNSRLLIIISLFLVPLLASPLTVLYPKLLLRGKQVRTDFPAWSLNSFLDKTYQQQLEQWSAENFGLRAVFIVANNTLFYYMLKKVYAPTPETETWIGQHRWLYTKGYVVDYLAKPLDETTLNTQVAKLKQLQDTLAVRGKTLLIHITPSKVAVYPENLPPRFFLLGVYQPDRKSYNNHYEQFKRLTQHHRLHVADSAARLRHEKSLAPDQRLFPQGGIHWNDLGRFYGASHLIETLEYCMHQKLVHPEILTRSWNDDPTGDDRDLVNTLNVYPSPVHYYPTQHLVFVADPATVKHHSLKPTVAIVGNSFNWGLIDVLSRIDFYDRLSFYFYLHRIHAQYAHGKNIAMIENPTEPIAQTIQHIIEKHQVIILELNETAIADLNNTHSYETAFIDAVQTYLEKHPR